ncbi:MAG: DHH family phosphoesterase [Bacteroidales bacterium]|nr:DHH family phosphoesterase [Bacteroidales bacterium]
MRSIDANDISALAGLLQSCSDFVIVIHTHPDGDAVGSGCALQEFIASVPGKKVRVITPDAPPFTLDFLCEGRDFLDASAKPAEAAALIAGCDALICLDFNAFRRTEGLAPLLAASPARKVLIDHHLNPERDAFELCFSCTEVSSACELLYEVLKALPQVGGDVCKLPPFSRYALMTGMTTDTNNFANSVYPGTLRMAGELLQAGVDRDDILDRLYRQDRPQKLHAFADLLGSHLEILPGGIACIYMSEAMKAAYGISEGETEGLVNIPLSLAEVRMSIFAREENGVIRVSLRSKPGLSANELAARFFHGGGHTLASGGKIFIPDDISSESGARDYIAAAAARFLQDEGGPEK